VSLVLPSYLGEVGVTETLPDSDNHQAPIAAALPPPKTKCPFPDCACVELVVPNCTACGISSVTLSFDYKTRLHSFRPCNIESVVPDTSVNTVPA
jgi:hypothetical protein